LYACGWRKPHPSTKSLICSDLRPSCCPLFFVLWPCPTPREQQFARHNIAADYFALRKVPNGAKRAFTEGRNAYHSASHCDIAWAGALATHAHTECRCQIGAAVLYDNGWFKGKDFHPLGSVKPVSPEHALLWSDDPGIWRRLC